MGYTETGIPLRDQTFSDLVQADESTAIDDPLGIIFAAYNSLLREINLSSRKLERIFETLQLQEQDYQDFISKSASSRMISSQEFLVKRAHLSFLIQQMRDQQDDETEKRDNRADILEAVLNGNIIMFLMYAQQEIVRLRKLQTIHQQSKNFQPEEKTFDLLVQYWRLTILHLPHYFDQFLLARSGKYTRSTHSLS